MKIKYLYLNFSFIILFFSCKTLDVNRAKPITKTSIKFLSYYEIPHNTSFEGTLIGGISGIDYHPIEDTYYFISDDRSVYNAARFYNLKITSNLSKIDTVIINKLITLKNEEGKNYPKQYIDPESIRIHPKNPSKIYFSSEGGKLGTPKIDRISKTGELVETLNLPEQFIQAMRSNKAIESLTISTNGKQLYFASESSLKTDGKESTVDSTSLVRIQAWDFNLQKVIRQYEYRLSKLPKGSIDVGLTELLYLNDSHLLSLERSGRREKNGSYTFQVKCFLVTLTNEKNNQGLYKTKKQILIDFNKLDIPVYNIEGMTFGKTINGQKELIFVSDNNFKKDPTILYHFLVKKTKD